SKPHENLQFPFSLVIFPSLLLLLPLNTTTVPLPHAGPSPLSQNSLAGQIDMKRRIRDSEVVQPVSAKRVASSSCDTACGSSETLHPQAASPFLVGSVPPVQGAFFPQEVWLAVAAQMRDALAALPGWIQMAQASHADQFELYSSVPSASSPLEFMSLPHLSQAQSLPEVQPSLHGTTRYTNTITRPTNDAQPETGFATSVACAQASASVTAGSGAATATAAPASSASARASISGAAADLPAQPAPAGVDSGSCSSECDTAAACGWFSKCRGCCQLTAGETEIHGQVIPLCRGCSNSLWKRTSADREHMVHRLLRAHATLCQREAAGAF
ncbi:hypothetical protein Agub_g1787, partial [Astrephomene gubernaculifera]